MQHYVVSIEEGENPQTVFTELGEKAEMVTRTRRVEVENEVLRATVEILERRLAEHEQRPHNPFELDLDLDEPAAGPWVVWSTLYIQPETIISHTRSRIFSTPLGQIGQGALSGMDSVDTNLKEGGRLPQLSQDSVLIPAISCEIIGGSPEDIRHIRDNTTIHLDLIQYEYSLAPLGRFAWDDLGRRGVLRFSDRTSPSTTERPSGTYNDGETFAAAGLTVDGIVLPEHSTFGFILGFGRGNRDADRKIDKLVRIRIALSCYPMSGLAQLARAV